MPKGSRRYFTTTLPVEHINGKMAPSSVKCKNTHTSDQENDGFYYGYKRLKSDTSHFAIRIKSRDLNTKPYTTQENENKALFTSSIEQVQRYRREPQAWELCMQDFRLQNAYSTPIGFAIAMTRKNGGEWLPKWIP